MVFGALREKSMDVSVGVCLKQNMASRREKRERKVRLGQNLESLKLDMRQTIFESCALDEQGYMHRRGRAEHECVKAGATNKTWPIQDGERERKRVLGQD